MHYVQNMQNKNGSIQSTISHIVDILKTNQFGLEEKNMQLHINYSPSYKL
jgi:hypothetical protein